MNGYLLDVDAEGYVHVADFRLCLLDDLAHRDSGDDGRDGDYALAVLALDCRGREALDDLADVLDADALAGGVVDEYVFDVVNRPAVSFLYYFRCTENQD